MSTNDEKTEKEDIQKRATNAIEEARMVIPGIQALFGFQLVAGFNQKFQELSESLQKLHFAALVLIATAIALIMAPAAYHRLVEQGGVSKFFVHLASTLIPLAMLPLMLAICTDVFLLGHLILRDDVISVWVAGLLMGLFAVLWFCFHSSQEWSSRLDIDRLCPVLGSGD